MSTHQGTPRPPVRTTHIAEIEDPVTGELTVLEAATAVELDELIEAFASYPSLELPPEPR
mgnify:CR=1 FL=1